MSDLLRMRLILFCIAAGLGMLAAGGCSLVGTPIQASGHADANPSPEKTAAIPAAGPTSLMAEGPVTIETPKPELLPSATPTEPPMRFEFPSQNVLPESAWRPPLYPVPWAPTENDHFYFIRPIGANEVNWPNGSYRYGGIFFEDNIHSGVDIQAPLGTPVLAAGSGKVIWAGYGLYSGVEGPDDPYGLAVAIRHDFGFQGGTLYTLYAHLSQVEVIRGQRVDTGQQIGLVGRTGFATGPHLHFEVRLGENDFFTTYNPELWVAPPEGWGLLVGRVMGTAGQVLNRQEVILKNLDTGQVWETVTYGDTLSVNPDPYYRENFVIGDLPAGRYEVTVPYLGRMNRISFEIFPGRVTYFIYQGRNGFTFGTPDELRPTPAPTETP